MVILIGKPQAELRRPPREVSHHRPFRRFLTTHRHRKDFIPISILHRLVSCHLGTKVNLLQRAVPTVRITLLRWCRIIRWHRLASSRTTLPQSLPAHFRRPQMGHRLLVLNPRMRRGMLHNQKKLKGRPMALLHLAKSDPARTRAAKQSQRSKRPARLHKRVPPLAEQPEEVMTLLIRERIAPMTTDCWPCLPAIRRRYSLVSLVYPVF